MSRQEMIQKAKDRDGEILPCADKSSLEDCFTDEEGIGLLFWYNTLFWNERKKKKLLRANNV